MNWNTIDRPGQVGGKRDKLCEMYNNTYGSENWRIAWQWRNDVVEKELAY